MARTGQALVTGPRQPRVKWVFRALDRIYAEPVLTPDGKTVVVASFDGYVYAVDATTGLKRWRVQTGGKVWGAPLVTADRIYVGSDADAVWALDLEGRVVWKYATCPSGGGDAQCDMDTSLARLSDGTLIAAFGNVVAALSPFSGAEKWRTPVAPPGVKVFSSPAIGRDDTIYVGTQGDHLVALNPAGTVLWHREVGGDADATPAVAGEAVVFGVDDGTVRAFSQRGIPLWRAAVGAPVRAPITVVTRGPTAGTVLAATYGRRPFVVALDGATGAERWRFSIGPGEGDFFGIQSGVTVDREGYAYFGGRDGGIYCLRPDGALAWRHQVGDQVDAGPVLGPDGTLYAGSDDHRLYAIENTGSTRRP